MDASADLSWDEAHHALVPLMRADNRTNLVYLAREYVLLAAVLLACVGTHRAWSVGSVSMWVFAPCAAVGVLAVAACQHRLSGLAHEASHYTLLRNKLANELASDLLLLFPLMAMTQAYRAAHLGHHRFVNDPLRDPDLLRLNHPRPQVFPISKAGFWRKYVLRGLWPPAILGYLLGRAKAANSGPGPTGPALETVYGRRVAQCLRGAYWLAAFAVIQALGVWPLFALFWVVPLLTAYPLLMQLREIAHHSNAPDDGDLTNSRVFRVNPLLSACIFPYGQAFHLTHHLFAMVPHHRLAEAHAILNRHRPYRGQVVVCRGYFFRGRGGSGPSVLDVLAQAPDGLRAVPASGPYPGSAAPRPAPGPASR
jgi:fatty acid desaturase